MINRIVTFIITLACISAGNAQITAYTSHAQHSESGKSEINYHPEYTGAITRIIQQPNDQRALDAFETLIESVYQKQGILAYQNKAFLSALIYANLSSPENFHEYLDRHLSARDIQNQEDAFLRNGLSLILLRKKLRDNDYPCPECPEIKDLKIEMETNPEYAEKPEWMYLKMHLNFTINDWLAASEDAMRIKNHPDQSPLALAIKKNVSHEQAQLLNFRIN